MDCHVWPYAESRPTIDALPPAWFFLEEDFSLFRCLLHCKGFLGSDIDEPLDAYVMNMVIHMGELPELDDIFDNDDAKDMVSGEMVVGTLAIFSTVDMEKWEITLSDLTLEGKVLSTFVYEVDDPMKQLQLQEQEITSVWRLTWISV